MIELILIRHGQASLGAANYDVLSDLGHSQARALGEAMAVYGTRPVAWYMGGMRRHRETFEGVREGIGEPDVEAEILEGLNEFAFKELLDAHYHDREQPKFTGDRKAYFAVLRDTVLAWQRDEIPNPPETFAAFGERVAQAFETLAAGARAPVVAVTSGGPIGLLASRALGAAPEQMLRLQMQIKNASVTRLRVGEGQTYLHTFNETPHIDAMAAHLLTYS